MPALGDDESYALDVDTQHMALHARTEIGALRGMETLLQLVQPEGSGFVLPAVHIEDAPRFPWRGLLLDPGRHFLPVDVVYRTLDGMASVKLNVLHWHLTEDQGFRIESKVFPKLQGVGSDGLYYTQQQVKAVVAYAAARGIRVVPEFDMPGHSTSWMVGYPQLGSAPGPYEVQHTFGIHDQAFSPINEGTYRFLDAFFGEMSTLFPDAYVHIGGDESNGKQWRANPAIRAFMKAHGMTTTQELQAYFNKRIEKILEKHHKRMVGWDEILNPALPPDVVVQVWHGNQFLADAARQGHQGLYSQPYYLDDSHTAAAMFLADPVPEGANLTPDQLKKILGGEACMWGEHVTALSIDSRIWPRTAAVAERLWSPATDRDTDDLYRRLGVETLRLEAEGVPVVTETERRLLELAGTVHDEPLRLFAATLQPVDFGELFREQHTTQLTVLDHLVDAVPFDPPLRHELEVMVDGGAARRCGRRAQARCAVPLVGGRGAGTGQAGSRIAAAATSREPHCRLAEAGCDGSGGAWLLAHRQSGSGWMEGGADGSVAGGDQTSGAGGFCGAGAAGQAGGRGEGGRGRAVRLRNFGSIGEGDRTCTSSLPHRSACRLPRRGVWPTWWARCRRNWRSWGTASRFTCRFMRG